MPWRVKDAVELRIEFVKRAIEGEGLASLCREYGISRPTGYLWVKRFEESGSHLSLFDRSHRPKSSPNRTSKKLESLIVKLRERYGWGADKLGWILLHRYQLTISRVTINRIISRNGLLRIEDRHCPALKRFERAHPNELWQVDLKGCMGGGEARCEPLSMLDDHSRFLVGLFPTRTSKLEPIQKAFYRTFNKYGIPEALLMDHGVPWWSNSQFLGLTRLSVWLMKQDIKLLFSGFNHPQTQGKVERFHRTLAHAVRHKGTPTSFCRWTPLLATIRREYNDERPHEALGMNVPSSRYIPSTKSFNPKPTLPEYPSSATIVKIDSHGMFTFKKRRLFASHALVGEYVALEQIQSSLLLRYRRTPFRQIDLRTCKTLPFTPVELE